MLYSEKDKINWYVREETYKTCYHPRLLSVWITVLQRPTWPPNKTPIKDVVLCAGWGVVISLFQIKKASLSCSWAPQPACWWSICLYVLAVCRETFCLGNDFSKPPRPPCSHTLHNMLLKQTIKLSCLTTHLSSLYPAASSITQSLSLIHVLQLKCVQELLWGRNHPKPSQQQFLGWSGALRSTDKPQIHTHAQTQTTPDSALCFNLVLYPWTRFIAGGKVQAT